MFKTIGKKLIWVAALCSLASLGFANCNAFESEAEAFEGIVPKFNEDGSIKSMSMYGEGTFLVAKRSLITDARRKAELSARRALSEFLTSDFSASTVASSLIETSQNTDQDGNTTGSADELESTLNLMKNDSAAVMRGVVKLDECVDAEGKYLLVRMGWKPELSRAAAGVAGVMEEHANSSGREDAKRSKIKPSEGYRKKSSLADDF